MTPPKDETARLEALGLYAILDTEPEEPFDSLARLAAHVCSVPIALVSFVDERRQWFKSRVGLDAVEIPRNVGFCRQAIRQDEVFVVEDTLTDARFADDPLVSCDPRIRFYAGAPLLTPDGHALGTLCVLDKVPRKLNAEQQQAMRVLARHVMTQLELRRHTRELAAARNVQEEKDGELRLAQAELRRLKKKLARLE